MTHYVCEATDSIGFKSYLSIIEEVDEAGNIELIVMPTYDSTEAYKYPDRGSAEQATKEFTFPTISWEVKEVE